jgi:hypothetical protein
MPAPRLSLHPRCLTLTLASLALLTSAPGLEAQDLNGESLNGTVNLSGGFLPDPHVIDIVPGGDTVVEDLGAGCTGYIFAAQPDLKVVLDSASAQFGIFVNSNIDTTLVVNDPNGGWHCNDDASFLTNSNPGLLFESPVDGTYDIWVGTYSDVGTDSTGKLVLTEWSTSDWASMDLGGGGGTAIVSDGIDFGDDLSSWANDGECDDPRFEGEGSASTLLDDDRYHDATDCSAAYQAGTVQLAGDASGGGTSSELAGSQRGRLDTTDPVLSGNGYVDRYTFQGSAGSTAIVDLRSADFDTFLRVTSPSGEVFTNDDYEGGIDRSMVSLDLGETGEYTVEVTSYSSDATGSYTLDMTSGLQSAPVDMENRGTLASGDGTYSEGEYFDSYEFEGQPGQAVTIDLRSDDFDTYLVLEGPGGQREVNDDADSTAHSQIVTQLSQLGTYTVHVTSYGGGETGDYVVSISQGTGGGGQVTANDSVALGLGQSTSGSLEAADTRTEDGKYEDVYSFDGSAGETLSVDLNSGEFDTYLTVVAPSGQTFENDDFDGSTSRSVVDFTLPESGRYRIVATTYASDTTGSYQLALSSGTGNSTSTAIFLPSNSGGGQIYGIFAGIADYAGDDNDLDLTDQDALRTRDALIEGAGMNPANAYTLIDGDATFGNFTSAMNNIGSQIGPDDTLVIFYSGHGSQHPRADGPNNTDPDGVDESLVLYDDYLMDDQLGAMLDGMNAGRVLLVFDSCFSGGFAKDVVSAPGRMGLFSSEEDVTSQVAYKFEAGGYLAVFFEDAVRGHFADGDQNSQLTAMELSEYIHERYRFDVKPEGSEAASARVTGPAAVYQHLVVDRGGITADSVLFYH